MNVRKRLLVAGAVIAASLVSACVPISSTNLLWKDDFTAPLALATDAHANTWRTRGADDRLPMDNGWKDYVSDTYNLGSRQGLNPFNVSGSILTITARKNWGVPFTNAAYLSGYLSTDYRKVSFEYGYFEFRARVPNPAAGMLGGLWLYAEPGTPAAKARNEIDVAEFFGSDPGVPFGQVLHTNTYKSVASYQVADLKSWHTYAVDWQPTYIRFYRDGILTASYGPDVAAMYQGAQMSIRLSLGVNTSWGAKATTTPITMQVDRVRVYKHQP